MLISQGRQLPSRPAQAPATQVLVHESVTLTRSVALAVLASKGLGVHWSIGPEGSIEQHAPVTHRTYHCRAGHNAVALGVEVINPYYPPARPPWTQEIDAPWAHRKRYVVPLLAQCEALAWLVREATEGGLGLPQPIPRRWIGLEPGGFMRLGQDPDPPSAPGIWCHHYQGAHADGAWPALYAWLRLEAGLDPDEAYRQAIRRATGTRRADVSDLLRAEG